MWDTILQVASSGAYSLSCPDTVDNRNAEDKEGGGMGSSRSLIITSSKSNNLGTANTVYHCASCDGPTCAGASASLNTTDCAT